MTKSKLVNPWDEESVRARYALNDEKKFPLSENPFMSRGGVSQTLYGYRYVTKRILETCRNNEMLHDPEDIGDLPLIGTVLFSKAKLFRLPTSLVIDLLRRGIGERRDNNLPDYPADLPFDHFYLSFCDDDNRLGYGQLMPPLSAEAFCEAFPYQRYMKVLRQRAVEGSMLSHLVGCLVTREAADIFIHGFTGLENPVVHDPALMLAPSNVYALPLYRHGEWALYGSLLPPSVLVGLINYINSFQTFIATRNPTSNDRHFFRKKFKKPPPNYYEIKLKQEVLYDQPVTRSDSNRGGGRLTYRFDVRGHECCRVKRGSHPLAPDKAEKLRERGYRVYIHRELSPEDSARLHKRRMAPKSKNEWVAVLSYFRDGYEKGPEDAPFIPAMRTP